MSEGKRFGAKLTRIESGQGLAPRAFALKYLADAAKLYSGPLSRASKRAEHLPLPLLAHPLDLPHARPAPAPSPLEPTPTNDQPLEVFKLVYILHRAFESHREVLGADLSGRAEEDERGEVGGGAKGIEESGTGVGELDSEIGKGSAVREKVVEVAA